MKVRSTKLTLETLEDRCVPATVEYADFNKDGNLDMAALTSSTTITVSLANLDGSYTVSATLTAPKSLPMGGFSVGDYNGDGNLDIRSGGLTLASTSTPGWETATAPSAIGLPRRAAASEMGGSLIRDYAWQWPSRFA